MVDEKIDRFSGKNKFLSNFELCDAVYDGTIYPSSEHAYQAAKTLDESERKKISKLPTPGDAKRAGKKVTLRPDWNTIKIHVMAQIVCDKFSRSDKLQQQLLATGEAHLEEGNNWGDKFWGTVDGSGRNELGKILMNIRNELRGKKK